VRDAGVVEGETDERAHVVVDGLLGDDRDPATAA
jgi:hypothetical protein